MHNIFRIPNSVFFPVYLILLLSFCVSLVRAEETRYRPYVLAENAAGELQAKLESTRAALKKQNFTIAGEYSPYEGAHIIAVTSPELKQIAAQSEFGGYGVVHRIGVTRVNGNIQVAYTNPYYMHAVYRMKGDISGVADRLEQALGKQKTFGSGEGMTAEELADYHYMVFMPYFTDHIELASYDDQETAVSTVEAGLQAGKGGSGKVFRVDIPGKPQTLFGVSLQTGEGADKTVMKTIDTEEIRHTPHLPYELLVSGGKVYMLHAKFRIALSFPDLAMGTFMQISDAPAGIERAMLALVD